MAQFPISDQGRGQYRKVAGQDGGGMPSGSYPVTWTFAGLVLVALVGLVILRRLTGTISIT